MIRVNDTVIGNNRQVDITGHQKVDLYFTFYSPYRICCWMLYCFTN